MPHPIARSIPLVLVIAVAGWYQNLAAADTREGDAKAIRDADARLVRNANARNLEGVADIYAADASFMMPNAPAFHGREAIKVPWKRFLTDPNFALICTPAKVEVSKAGDFGFVQGAYTFTMTDGKTQKAANELGKYVMVFKKQADGSWRIAAEIFNADAPAAPVQASAK